MHKLPTDLVPHADQARARADNVLGQMVAALRTDLGGDIDSTFAWYYLVQSFGANTPEHLATGFASALLRLAQTPPRQLTAAPVFLKHRSRVRRQGDRHWSTTCLVCGATYPTVSQPDAMFLGRYHWRACD